MITQAPSPRGRTGEPHLRAETVGRSAWCVAATCWCQGLCLWAAGAAPALLSDTVPHVGTHGGAALPAPGPLAQRQDTGSPVTLREPDGAQAGRELQFPTRLMDLPSLQGQVRKG